MSIIKKILLLFHPVCWETRLNSAKQSDVMLSCTDGNRPYIYNGFHYSPLIDSLSFFLQKRGISTIRFSDKITYFRTNSTFGSPLSVNRSLSIVRVIKYICIALQFKQADLDNLVVKKEALIWDQLMILVKPKIVIGIQPTPSLCYVCNSKSIPIFDLQHGLISDSPDNSYYWSERLNRCDPSYVPYGFLCWNESSKNKILQIEALSTKKIFVIGNPWVLRYSNINKNDTLAYDSYREFKLLNTYNYKVIVLVTLQYNLKEYAKEYITNGVMVDSLVDIINETSGIIYWMIRLHPNQILGDEKEMVSSFFKKNFNDHKSIDWNYASSAPLPLLLSKSSIHITHYSSCTIEAAMASKHTLLLDPMISKGGLHEDIYHEEREAGLATVVDLDEESIKKSILDNVSSSNKKHFFSNKPIYDFISSTLS